MKSLYFINIFGIIVAIAAFAFGYISHKGQLSHTGLSPEQLQEELKEQDIETRALRANLDSALVRNAELEDLQLQLKSRVKKLAAEEKEAADAHAAYREITEKELTRLREAEIFFMYRADPATYEDIKAIKTYLADIEKGLSPDELASLQKLEPYRELKSLLKRLPHFGR